MKNIVRTLIYDGQVSLTIADTTELVKEGARLHGLSSASTYIFGKALSLMTFMSACLKNERGEISLSLKGDGTSGEIGVSGNNRLQMRGYILNTQAKGETNLDGETKLLCGDVSITIIRDDGYSRPFVGSCALPPNAGLDEGFEEYFRISEQLPTRLYSNVVVDQQGKCLFAGVVALQPLPFADSETLKKVDSLDLALILQKVEKEGAMYAAKDTFVLDESTLKERFAQYQCNCSREYLTGVLVSLGEAQMREIIREEGAVRVHCHYCNTNYEFTSADADALFSK